MKIEGLLYIQEYPISSIIVGTGLYYIVCAQKGSTIFIRLQGRVFPCLALLQINVTKPAL